MDGTAELGVNDLRSARNIFVCGRTFLGNGGAQATTITLSDNGTQSKTCVLNAGVSFNIRMAAPVLVSHFVVDDQIIAVALRY